jgi:hypothetical protein
MLLRGDTCGRHSHAEVSGRRLQGSRAQTTMSLSVARDSEPVRMIGVNEPRPQYGPTGY